MFSNKFDYNIEKNRISKLLSEKKTNGIEITDLTESNPTNAGFVYDKDLILKAIAKEDSLRYAPEPKGMLAGRKAISEYYRKKNINVEPDNIFLTSGTSEAYSFIFKLLTNPFDEVLIPAPGYPLFAYIAEMESLNTLSYNLIYTKNAEWKIDFNSIESQITEKTKAIILVNPNNPTGHYIKKNELKDLIRICKKYNLSVISDEVFWDYNIDINFEDIVSLASINEILTFTLSGISKICGLPQMKLSWFIVNGEKMLCDEAKSKLEIIADTFLSVGIPIQLGINDILENENNIGEQIKNRVKRNYYYLKEKVTVIVDVELLSAEGGWYSVLKIETGIEEEILAFELLKEKNIYIHPGYFFDFEEGCNIVVSLLTPESVFKNGINGIMEYLGKSQNM